ncbi:LpqB family beta-propeller domain-containing protein [Kitasatospora sp. NPDC015120]|uniref:LpqB family beta-propeller domain-containing protein n=1 Tax=Kitasatospora sp. NPDC015120 TaxID=3364023 RepID=UPI0036F48F5B
MRRTSGRTEPRLAGVAGALLGTLLAGGCAAMPDSGGVTKIELSKSPADKNFQVRVFPVEPTKGARPQELLAGFLDALTADDDYGTARKYLTPAAAARWNAETGVKVLGGTPTRPEVNVTESDMDVSIPLLGQLVAEVDERHSFRTEAPRDLRIDFSFVREKAGGEWRIDKLPDGLILNEANFRNSYRQVDRFFYAAPDPSAASVGSVTNQDVLIADPIYLRRRIDPLGSAANALVAGPSKWLAPVARSAFPDGAKVHAVTLDGNQTGHVTLADVDLGSLTTCRRMATQLLYTLADQGTGQIDQLELKGTRGGPACQASRGDEPVTGPGSLAGRMATRQFYQREDDGALYESRGSDGDGVPVQGPLGRAQPSGRRLGTIAVARDGEHAAAISGDGHQLYTVPFTDGAGATMPPPVLTTPSRPGTKAEDGLASPTWDGRGDLYVVDRDPQSPKVLLVREKKVVEVPVERLDGRSVQGIKVSSDGARVALLLKDGKDGKDDGKGYSLWLGLLVHEGTKDAPSAKITGLRLANPAFEEVVSVSWAEADQLLVLGKEKDKLQQLHYVSTDGSPNPDARLPGGGEMTTVAASEYRGNGNGGTPLVPPVLALQGAQGKPYRLVNSQWRELGLLYRVSSFIYPG